MYAVASINTEDYQDLADLTDALKKEYCARHGYKFFVLKVKKYCPKFGFNKIHFVLDLFTKYPDIEWLLFSECDAVITNLDIKIEDKIDNDYHFIVPVDRLNINAGNFLARNSEQGRAYLQMILDNEPRYNNEQLVIIATTKKQQNIVKLVTQRYMNSYEAHIYKDCDVSHDIWGKSGNWELGDWIVHWPGANKSLRLERAQVIISLVVRGSP